MYDDEIPQTLSKRDRAKAAKILREWAADFEATGNEAEAEFWGCIATGVAMAPARTEIFGLGADYLKAKLNGKSTPLPEEIANSLPFDVRQSVEHIRQEAVWLRKVLLPHID